MKKALTKNSYSVLDGAFGFSMAIMAVAVVSISVGFINLASENMWFNLTAMAVFQLCFVLIWANYSRGKGICPVKAARVSLPTAAGALFALFVALACFAVGIGIEQLLLAFFQRIGYQLTEIELSVPQLVVFGLITVLLAPVGEELIFRGIVLRSLEKRRVLAILLCGALFSVFHMSPEQTVYQFLFGCALAFVALKTNSVFPAMLGHLVSNALAFGRFFLSDSAGSAFNWVVVGAGCASVVAAVLLIAFKARLARPSCPDCTDCAAESDDLQLANPSPLLNPTNHLVALVYLVGIGVCLLTWIITLIHGLTLPPPL